MNPISACASGDIGKDRCIRTLNVVEGQEQGDQNRGSSIQTMTSTIGVYQLTALTVQAHGLTDGYTLGSLHVASAFVHHPYNIYINAPNTHSIHHSDFWSRHMLRLSRVVLLPLSSSLHAFSSSYPFLLRESKITVM